MKRIVYYIGLLAAAYVAVQGGEYSTTDILRQRQREARLVALVDSLRRDVDSLKVLRGRLASDPALQERVARENHGMVRGDKELVYRFIDTGRVR